MSGFYEVDVTCTQGGTNSTGFYDAECVTDPTCNSSPGFFWDMCVDGPCNPTPPCEYWSCTSLDEAFVADNAEWEFLNLYNTTATYTDHMGTTWAEAETQWSYYYWWISGPSDPNSDWGTTGGLQRYDITQVDNGELERDIVICQDDGQGGTTTQRMDWGVSVEGNTSVTAMSFPFGVNDNVHDYDYQTNPTGTKYGNNTCAMSIYGFRGGATATNELIRNPGPYWRVVDSTGPVNPPVSAPTFSCSIQSNGSGGHDLRFYLGQDADEAGTPVAWRNSMTLDVGTRIVDGEEITVFMSFDHDKPIVKPSTIDPGNDDFAFFQCTLTVMIFCEDGTEVTGSVTGSEVRGGSAANDPVVGIRWEAHTRLSSPTFFYGLDGWFLGVFWAAWLPYDTDYDTWYALNKAWKQNRLSYVDPNIATNNCIGDGMQRYDQYAFEDAVNLMFDNSWPLNYPDDGNGSTGNPGDMEPNSITPANHLDYEDYLAFNEETSMGIDVGAGRWSWFVRMNSFYGLRTGGTSSAPNTWIGAEGCLGMFGYSKSNPALTWHQLEIDAGKGFRVRNHDGKIEIWTHGFTTNLATTPGTLSDQVNADGTAPLWFVNYRFSGTNFEWEIYRDGVLDQSGTHDLGETIAVDDVDKNYLWQGNSIGDEINHNSYGKWIMHKATWITTTELATLETAKAINNIDYLQPA